MKKVAVIGAGKWGKNLIRTFHELNALGAIVESDPKTRAFLEKEWAGTPVYPDVTFLLHETIHAVAIATPVNTHYATAKKCLESGFDTFVEKPMTMTSAEAELINRLATQKNLVLMVGHLLLYQPAIRWISSSLREGGLGKVHSFHQERLNLGKARSAESVLWSLGVHDIAVLVGLIGTDPESIQINGHRVLQKNIDDDVYLHMTFPRGVQAHLHCSWLWPDKRRGLTVVGEKRMLVYDEITQTVTLHRKHIGPDLNNRDKGSEVVFRQTEQPLLLELKHFLDRLEDRKPPLSDGLNGVRVIKILEKASQLLEQRKP